MRCPTLSELPPPPPGKTGWPWTEQTEPLPERMPDGSEWPRISIVTPTYNYGRFIEETIRSVLLQGYPNLEYIIIDGGSTDNSVEVIKKYEQWLTYWVSEKDNGQTHAINKGIKRCNGEIFNWLNSDDQLLLSALKEVACVWNEHHPDILIGSGITVDAFTGEILQDWRPKLPRQPFDLIEQGQVGLGMSQPATFLKLSLVKAIDYVREDLHYAFDYALYLKVLTISRHNCKLATTASILAKCLSHPDAKTVQTWPSFIKEIKCVLQEMYPHFLFAEKLQVSWYLKQIETQELVTKVLHAPEGALWRLTALPFQHPHVCLSRFFWGALRKITLAPIR